MRYLLFFCICLSGTAGGQDFPRRSIDVAKIADEIYGIQDLDLNYEELYENLLQLHSHPLDLNRVSDEELRFVKVLTEHQIKSLLNYRKENNSFISIYELQAVPGFDLHTITLFAPFITVKDPSAAIDQQLLNRLLKESDNYFLVRYERTIQNKAGHTPGIDSASQFKGSPNKLYVRFRSSKAGDFSVGFTAEKDPGEVITWNTSKKYYGFDYSSFHVQLQNKGKLKNLVIGDFQSQFGQGLMLGGIFGTGKGGETITTTRRSNVGVMPYTSVHEAGYLRGAAATTELIPHLYLTGFYSNVLRDANLAIDTTSDAITAFQTTGLHRNDNELSKRKVVRDKNWGIALNYKIDGLDVGLMFNTVTFNANVSRNMTPYNQFVFQGKENSNVGTYINYTFQSMTFFSEFARSLGGGNAITGGVLWSVTDKFDLSVLFRKFDRNFYSFYSNAFSENSSPQNESGIYWGWKHRTDYKITFSGYVDLFKFPWLKYRTYAPSVGHEWLLRLTYQPSRKVALFVQGREEVKDRNISDNTMRYLTAEGKKANYMISIEFGLRQKLKLKTRAQFSTYRFNDVKTCGFVLLQDISADMGKFQITGRYALFDTDDYDNRQYVYENDVWLAYSMPAYAGVGIRKILMIEYKLNRFMSFWLRYASMRYPNEEKIGSGVEAIGTNIKNDIKFQVRITF